MASGRGRRSPAPEERQRDPERTRRALLDAALVEFAAKGRAGARVSEIAERAGVNKQLISYYFGGKQGLYDALVERWLGQEAEFAPRDLPLDELVSRYIADSVGNRDMYRLMIRESLEGLAMPAPEDAASGESPEVADLRRRQEEGELASDLDPALLLLMFQAAASVGVLFPGNVRELTGLDPSSEDFTDRYGAMIRRVVQHLGR
jgi:TetR/AcrR family transcriptional regulator